VFEALGAPLLYGALTVVRWYRPSFHRTSGWVYRAAGSLGVYPVIDHYHDPLVSLRSIDREQALRPRSLPGLDLRSEAQLALLPTLNYADELEDAGARGDDGGLRPTFDNLAFGPGDAELLYSMIRERKPKRVIEVGSGHSTRFAARALDRNRTEGVVAQHICVEPYESPWLEQLGVEVLREPVESIGLSLFRSLEANDILFVDSSHVVRPQGDVLYLLHSVFPELSPGVLVHVHDVFTPRDYPLAWLERRWFWTEQYVLEALLVHSPRYEVVLALNHLFHDHRSALLRVCPALRQMPEKEPSSFWMRCARL
jgi:predicted O-methyltransferase YrrM